MKLERVEMTPDVIEMFRLHKRIPLHFYNKDGIILIYGKEDASPAEIDRLIRYSELGIYFDTEDKHLLTAQDWTEVPAGLTATKLITDKIANSLLDETQHLFDELRNAAVTSLHTRRTTQALSEIFNEFQSQEDVLTGLVNIIEKLHNKKSSIEVTLSTKRTVVAMAIKTRGTGYTSEAEKETREESIIELMMSAMLCDTGTSKMKMPGHRNLKKEEMDYVRNHPLLSYLLIAHESTIPQNVKRNLLCHHRPLREGTVGNNYPDLHSLIDKLEALKEKYTSETGHLELVRDISNQIQLLKKDIIYDEHANIIAIASEFASLTTEVPWREAYEPTEAVRMIVNNSLFTYTPRAVREFLDHVAISLCDNKKIIKEGDYVITHIRNSEGKNFFEVGIVTESDRNQSRPQLDRFASIEPIISDNPKLHISGFNTDSLKSDPRKAHYNLRMDDSRHIVYIVNKIENEELYVRLATLTGQL